MSGERNIAKVDYVAFADGSEPECNDTA